MQVNYGIYLPITACGIMQGYADDLLARLAMVPRCMEARGLDVTPYYRKIQASGDDSSVALLNRILTMR